MNRRICHWTLWVVVALGGALSPGVARADPYGADLAFLSALVTNSADEIVQLTNTLATLQKTYAEAKRVAGYADEAVQAFNAMKNFNGQLFGQSLVSGLNNAFPEVARIQNDLSGKSQWAQSSGELGLLLSGCLGSGLFNSGTSSCIQLQRAVTVADARSAVTKTFGTAPPQATRAQAMDDDAAVGLSASASQVGRNQVTRAQAQALMAACTGGTDDDAIAACQAAANAAQIQGLSHQSFMADQMAVQTRLQSDVVAQENAKHKDEIQARTAQTSFLSETSDRIQPTPTQVRTEGADIFGGSGGAQ
jgi:hypothetical protein